MTETKTQRRRGRPPRTLDGLAVGGVSAADLWHEYEEQATGCRTLRTRRAAWAGFAAWMTAGGEFLDADTLGRYAASVTGTRGAVAVRLAHVRGVLRAGIGAAMLPEGVVVGRRRGGHSRAARKIIPSLRLKSLPFLGDIPTDTPPKKRKAKKGFKKRFLADLFRLESVEWTLEDLRRSYRRLAARLHPDHGGDPARFRALTDAYTWLSQDMHSSVFKLCIWVSHDRHAEVERVSRAAFEALGGYEGLDELWGNI